MDPKLRFSTRVENYIKYRPGYPAGVLETLRIRCSLTPSSLIADIGSGTGLLAQLFLDFGCRVSGIEPNDEMRAAGERLLADQANFTSLAGSAEATGLPKASVDFVTAGQAFHWFDPPRARAEFLRILKPDGWVALVWNSRRTGSPPFSRAYEDLLNSYATDYAQVNHHAVEADERIIPEFFGGSFQQVDFDNVQIFDYDSLHGRLMSSSYAPEAGHPNHAPMLAELRRIFERFQQNGRVAFEYDTNLYYGQIQRSS